MIKENRMKSTNERSFSIAIAMRLCMCCVVLSLIFGWIEHTNHSIFSYFCFWAINHRWFFFFILLLLFCCCCYCWLNVVSQPTQMKNKMQAAGIKTNKNSKSRFQNFVLWICIRFYHDDAMRPFMCDVRVAVPFFSFYLVFNGMALCNQRWLSSLFIETKWSSKKCISVSVCVGQYGQSSVVWSIRDQIKGDFGSPSTLQPPVFNIVSDHFLWTKSVRRMRNRCAVVWSTNKWYTFSRFFW